MTVPLLPVDLSARPRDEEALPGVSVGDIDDMPAPGGVAYTRHVPYADREGAVAHVYARPGQRRPVVVLFFGGGGTPATVRRYCWLAARAGYVAVAPHFRGIGEAPWPAAAEDATAVVRWVRAAAPDLGADADAVIVGGASAGGHLALLLATSGEPGVVGAACLYPLYDTDALFDELPAETLLVAVGTTDPEQARQWSPAQLVTAACPPVLSLQGEADEQPHTAVGHARAFHARLRDLGVPERLCELAGGGHAFDIEYDGWRWAAGELLAWLRDTVPITEEQEHPRGR